MTPVAVVARVHKCTSQASILKFERRMFEMHGFKVYTAVNGEDGLRLMKVNTIRNHWKQKATPLSKQKHL